MANGGRNKRDQDQMRKLQRQAEKKLQQNPRQQTAGHGPNHQNEQRGDAPRQQGHQMHEEAQGGGTNGFVNPYTFVPTPDRRNIPGTVFAGDSDPLSNSEDHSRLWPERYTGALHLKMTVVTPVFIAKTPEIVTTNDGHKTYDCVEEIPATSVKGMLRSAYEAITNSRFGVFQEKQHDQRLGLRLPAEAGVIPARVVRNNSGNLAVELYCGESLIGQKGRPVFSNGRPAPQYAAWIPAYIQPRWLPPGNALPHGTKVSARIVLCVHEARRPWNFWRVVAMSPLGQTVTTPAQLPPPGRRWGYVTENNANIFETVEGYIVRSGKLIQNKHDERLFFNMNGAASMPAIAIDHTVQEEYNHLLSDYRETHADGAFPPIGNGVQHGSHITQRRVLQEGDFVYVSFDRAERPDRTLAKIFPVQISRDLHECSPLDCLPDSLRPATDMKKLSPADRLFGWVHQNGKGAWRGKVRVSVPMMMHPDGQAPLTRFPVDQRLPLAILGAPKPAQARFYLGDNSGLAQNSRTDKRSAGYKRDKKLRGRKIYWRPRLVANGNGQSREYWREPWIDRTNISTNGYHQEYRHPSGDDERTKQNRSITGWIRPGTVIRFCLRVENLAREELGGLLQLASLSEWAGEGAALRIGMGKPLGMGCLRLELDGEEAAAIGETKQWRTYFSSFHMPPEFFLDHEDIDDLKKAFGTALVTVYGSANITNWRDLEFIKAFAAASYGPRDGCPVHYPRTTSGRNSPNFAWFVANDTTRDGRTPGRSLPNPWQDSALPYNP